MSPIIFDGKVVALVSMSIEVTDRHRAEEALRESEFRYRNLFENMAEEVHFWKLVLLDKRSGKSYCLAELC